MKKRHRMSSAGFVVVIVGLVTAGLLIHNSQRDLRVQKKVEYYENQTMPLAVQYGSDDQSHVLVVVGAYPHAKYQLRTHDRNGKLVWGKDVPIRSSDAGVLISTSAHGYCCAGVTYPERAPRSTLLWAHIGSGGELLFKRLTPMPGNEIEMPETMLTDHALYVIGLAYSAEGAHSFISKLDLDGRLLWTEYGPYARGYQVITADSSGNPIVAGENDTAGVCIVKYSAGGRRLWLQNAAVRDVGNIIRFGSGMNDAIWNIVELHRGLSVARDAGYMLMTYGADGKLVEKSLLHGGKSLKMADAVMGHAGDLYVLYGRSDGIIELAKYDPDGHKLWSGAVRVPEECAARAITLDSKGAIYVFGNWNGGTSHPSRSIQGFVYRVRPPS